MVRSTLRVADDGKYYYDVNIDNYKLKKKGPSTNSPENKSGAEVENPSISASILSNWLEKIKEHAYENTQKFNQGIKVELNDPPNSAGRIGKTNKGPAFGVFLQRIDYLAGECESFSVNNINNNL